MEGGAAAIGAVDGGGCIRGCFVWRQAVGSAWAWAWTWAPTSPLPLATAGACGAVVAIPAAIAADVVAGVSACSISSCVRLRPDDVVGGGGDEGTESGLLRVVVAVAGVVNAFEPCGAG